MKIKLIDFGGIIPYRAHYNDAGTDVFTKERIELPPRCITKVPLGIGLELPDGFVAFIVPRSGMSSNGGITTEMVPIDSGYRGEIHAIVHNTTPEVKIIPAGTRIAQLIILPVRLPEFTFELGEARNDSAFGSSGDK